MKILAVETSAVSASAAVVQDDRVISEAYLNVGLTHSQTALPLIDRALKGACLSLEDVDLLAVAAGPGSFTGIRIGVSLVKGIGMAQNKPCVGASTLEGIAYNFYAVPCVVCAVMDARCSQVYNAIFRVTDNGVERLTPDRPIAIADLLHELEEYSETVYLAGDGAELCFGQAQAIGADVRLAPVQLRYQRAAGIGLLAKRMYDNAQAIDAEALLPIYLRLPQAERELKKRNVKGADK